MKEATKRAVEPQHASKWPEIRRACKRRQRLARGYDADQKCRYPFCNCTYPGEAAKARGEAA